MRVSSLALTSLLVLGTAMTGCAATPGVRESNANRLAFPVFMIPRDVNAEMFKLKTFERVYEKGGVANVYFEGSGHPYVTPTLEDTDPTPKNPVGLQMASYDPAPNVIWMGRPCQYRMNLVNAKKGDECPTKYLTDAMFAPEVIAAYDAALDDLKSRYGFTEFNLAGYDSGGGLAALIASARTDVLSLRTAAGLLDTQTYASAHGLPAMTASLNPIDATPHLANMPQHHYIAQFDAVVPNAVYHSYAQAINDERCMEYTFIQNVDHNYDWSEHWAAFVKEPVRCMKANPDDAERESRIRHYAPTIGPKK